MKLVKQFKSSKSIQSIPSKDTPKQKLAWLDEEDADAENADDDDDEESKCSEKTIDDQTSDKDATPRMKGITDNCSPLNLQNMSKLNESVDSNPNEEESLDEMIDPMSVYIMNPDDDFKIAEGDVLYCIGLHYHFE